MTNCVNDFVAIEFYNLPFDTIFRYRKVWSIKIGWQEYRQISSQTNLKWNIIPETLVMTHISSIPARLRSQIMR